MLVLHPMTLLVMLAIMLCGALPGCGGGGATTVPSVSGGSGDPQHGGIDTNGTPSPSPTPSLIGGLTPASAAYLNLDLSALANYTQLNLPAYYDASVLSSDNTPANNPTTNAGATLGRVLFYDKHLSINGTIACASCHQAAYGFVDPRQFSLGFSGSSFTTFHAMRLGNVRYYALGTMFWDKSAASLEAQALVPIQNSVEMGFTSANGGLTALTSTMASLPYYPELFKFVYGDANITSDRLSAALAQFERSMVTTKSRWDVGFAFVYDPSKPNHNLAGPYPTFTAQENRGLQLFMTGQNGGGLGCASCHVPPTFALDAKSKSNGLDAGETTIFKAPSLKNIGITGPYMHDGRFSTLAEVVEHYNSGILDGPALDPRLKSNGIPVQFNLSPADEVAVVAFLETLSDATFTGDPRFSSPFR